MTRLKPFRLHHPTSTAEASSLLHELGPDAVPYCGGTELLLVAKLGFTAFTDLVDLKRIDELSGITAADGLRIGAATTHREIEHSETVLDGWPTLASLERHVGNIRVRNVGTIGGNLAFADPHSDPATYLTAVGGSVTISGPGSARSVPIEEFVIAPYMTTLGQGELLTAVHIPQMLPGDVVVHRKMSFSERPAITVSVRVCVADGTLTRVRIAVGSVGPRVERALGAEQQLDRASLDGAITATVRAAAETAAAEIEPSADANGSAEYKRQLVRVLTQRCLSEALSRP
ncbi:MAG: xanthine dehydrogenase family protein subunit M [Acidobacteriota bacterium]|nr:xanthine dehydrogenase family protein subunit M [Acidobacteriota bacterium]